MPPINEQDLALVRQQIVNQASAERLYCVYRPALRTRELALHWKVKEPDTAQKAIQVLETYGDSLDHAPRTYTVDPVGSNVPYPGTWRVIEVRLGVAGEPPGVIQILREGWATTLDDSEVRIMGTKGDPATAGYSFTRYWSNIDPDYLASLTATLKATKSVTTPVVHNHYGADGAIAPTPQAGTYAASGVQGSRLQEDGAGVIQQTLTLVNSIVGANSAAVAIELYNLTHVDTRERDILALFGLTTYELDDAAGVPGTRYTKALVWRNLLDTTTAETKCLETLTSADILTLWSIGDNYSEAGRRWVREENGTATFIVLLREPTWANTWVNPVTVDKQSPDGWAVQERKRRRGIPESGRAAAVTAAGSTADSNRHVVGVGVSEGEEGERVVEQELKAIYATYTEAEAIVTEIVAYIYRRSQKGAKRVWPRRTLAAKNQLLYGAATIPTDGTVGVAQTNFTHNSIEYTHKEVQVQDHGDGAYTVTQIGMVPAYTSTVDWSDNHKYDFGFTDKVYEEYHIWVDYFTNFNLAVEFINANVADWTTVGHKNDNTTGIRYLGDGVFRAVRVMGKGEQPVE